MVDGVWQGRAERFARGRLTTTMDNFEGRVLLLQTKSLGGALPPTTPPPSARPRWGRGSFLLQLTNLKR